MSRWSSGRSRRLGALLASLAMLAAMSASPAAGQEQPPERTTESVCPPMGTRQSEEPLFTDIADSPHRDNIECVVQYRIARGYADGTYRPGHAVTRGQLATFVRTFAEVATAQELPQPDGDRFTDTASSPHEENIEAVAEAQIVRGYADGTYRPTVRVTREQLATFLAHAIDYADDLAVNNSAPPAASRSWFDDIDGSPHAGSINKLAEVGIVAGDGQGSYRPKAPVTRAQMATTLMRAADYLDEVGSWLYVGIEVAIQPYDMSAPVGEVVAYTVTVVDIEGRPWVDEEVVVEGFRWNTEEPLELARGRTDSNGEFLFEHEGPSTTDVDLLWVCLMPADCQDERTVVSDAAVVYWAQYAVAGSSTPEDVVVGHDPERARFDSARPRSDGSVRTVRWIYDTGDEFYDQRSDPANPVPVSRATFARRLVVESCVAVDTYEPGGVSRFRLIHCDETV